MNSSYSSGLISYSFIDTDVLGILSFTMSMLKKLFFSKSFVRKKHACGSYMVSCIMHFGLGILEFNLQSWHHLIPVLISNL